jgi:hypothetical protein
VPRCASLPLCENRSESADLPKPYSGLPKYVAGFRVFPRCFRPPADHVAEQLALVYVDGVLGSRDLNLVTHFDE